MYSDTSAFMDAYVGAGRPLDPSRYFIIQPAQLGSGLGSSPTNTPEPFNAGAFPPIAATARTPEHNRLFIELHTKLLTDDPAYAEGFYEHPHAVHRGLRRHAEALALMGVTARTFKEEAWRELVFASRADFLRGSSRPTSCRWTPNNLLCQARKWRAGDVGISVDGGTDAALRRITARTIAVAFAGDLSFPLEDIAEDAARIPGAESRTVGSVWGHFTMFGLPEVDVAEIDALYAEILAS